MSIPLSILDLTYIPSGYSAGETIQQSVKMAQLAEELGYARVWFAEHHNTRGLASGTPELMIAHVAAQTSTIRVGSGGVMLPNQAPLRVTESFHLLEAMYPGRIDLGLGRAPGTDQKTALALRRNPDALAAEDYPQNVLELLAYDDRSFPEGHFFESIIATPADQQLPPVWLLGSSAFSGQFAAQIGLGFSFAAHINKPMAIDVMRAYRAQFQPSERFSSPQSMLAVSVIVAGTDEEAAELSIINRVGMYRLLSGQMAPTPTLEEAKEIAKTIPPQYSLQMDSMLSNIFIGTPDRVMSEVRAFAHECEADEVMVTTSMADGDRRDYALREMMASWQRINQE